MSRTLVCLAMLSMAAALAIGSALIAANHGAIDDAYISYRYARNLAHGHGLVFNPGEPVEGYSNLLYVLMLAPAFRLGLDGASIYRVSVVLNAAASVGVLLLLVLQLRRRFGGAAALAGGTLLAASPLAWYWNASGMESVWVLLFQVAAWLAVSRLAEEDDAAMLGMALGAAVLLVLIRADGFVAALILVVYLALRKRWRLASYLGAATAAALVALIVWRLRYYGYPLPNAYYVKVSGALGNRVLFAGKQLIASRHMYVYWLVLGLRAAQAFWAWRRRRRFAEIPAHIFLAAGLLVYYLYVGGDFFGMRFLLFHIPASVCSLFAIRVTASGRRRLATVCAVAVVLAYQLAVPSRFGVPLSQLLLGRGARLHPPFWADLGRYLRTHEAGKVLAVDAAGQIPFYSGLYTVDMLGISDQYIAHLPPARDFLPGHSKYDAHYILARRPDLIAAWMPDEQQRAIGCGLSRELWSSSYVLKYMLYTAAYITPDGTPQVVDVENADDAEIASLHRRGYQYVVLKRRPEAGSAKSPAPGAERGR